jgi:hypothetical protein
LEAAAGEAGMAQGVRTEWRLDMYWRFKGACNIFTFHNRYIGFGTAAVE